MLAQAEREASRLQVAEGQILRLLERGAVSEDTAAARLAALRTGRDAAAERVHQAQLQVNAAALPKLEEVGKVATRLARNLRKAKPEEWSEACGILFPACPPFG